VHQVVLIVPQDKQVTVVVRVNIVPLVNFLVLMLVNVWLVVRGSMQIQIFFQRLIAWNVTMENIQQVGCVLIVLMENLPILEGPVYVYRVLLARLPKVNIGQSLVLPAQLGQAPILQITYIFVQCSAP
jgi:hypothetical protein